MTIGKLMYKGTAWCVRNAPMILAGISTAGVVATAVLSAEATPVALEMIAEKSKEKGYNLTAPEKVQAAWRAYVPAAISALTTIGAIIYGTYISQNRIAAITGLYSAAQFALNGYQQGVVKAIGPEREKEIRNEVITKQILSVPDIWSTGQGEDLCFEPWHGTKFRSSIPAIKDAFANAKLRLVSEMYMSENELRQMMNLPDVDSGTVLGFNVDHLPEVYFDSILIDNTSYILVCYGEPPITDYNRLW